MPDGADDDAAARTAAAGSEEPKCPGCGHPASAHDRWPMEAPSCGVCLDADDGESDCGYSAEVIVWLAAGRPICRRCLHPDYAHETSAQEDGVRVCSHANADDFDMTACMCNMDGGVIHVDHHKDWCCGGKNGGGKGGASG